MCSQNAKKDGVSDLLASYHAIIIVCSSSVTPEDTCVKINSVWVHTFMQECLAFYQRTRFIFETCTYSCSTSCVNIHYTNVTACPFFQYVKTFVASACVYCHKLT